MKHSPCASETQIAKFKGEVGDNCNWERQHERICESDVYIHQQA